MADIWIEHTDIPFPRVKTDIQMGLNKVLSSGALKSKCRSNADRNDVIEDAWTAAGGDVALIVMAVEAAIKGNANDLYMMSVIRNNLGQKPKATPKPKIATPGNGSKPAVSPAHVDRVDIPVTAAPEPTPITIEPEPPKTLTPSRFDFPPEIMIHHEKSFLVRGISTTFAMRSGVRSIADNEARKLGFATLLTNDQKSEGLQGLVFCYCDPDTREELSFRMKPDHTFLVQGATAKYLSRAGDKIKAYFPHTTLPDMLQDAGYQIIITEGEFKTLCLAEQIVPIASKKTCVIGLQGVNGGWHRDKIVVTHPDGTKETKKDGAAHLIDDLDGINWKKRVVYIVFDSDVGTKRHAEAFRKNKRMGAIGAEYTLAMLLRAKGAEVRIVVMPHDPASDKIGCDDYVYHHGKFALLQLIYNNWIVDRNIDEILYQGDGSSISFETAVELVASAPQKPDFILEGLLPVGGTAMLAGSPGIGKSFLALGLGYNVATGTDFLGMKTKRGGVIYIQSEIPRWAMAERIKSLDSVPDNLVIYSPRNLKLNYWEPDGFNKRRDTGMREAVHSLTRAIKDVGASLVIIDPLAHFHTMPENDPDAVRHLFETFREIAQVASCGVLIVHHHRKIGARKEQYEGAEDMRGSNALFAEPDSILSMYSVKNGDEAARLKLVFSKTRHCIPKDPVLLMRQNGTTLVWEYDVWEDSKKGPTGKESQMLQLMEELGVGLTTKELMQKTGIPSTTFYRTRNHLVELGKVKRTGTCWYLV